MKIEQWVNHAWVFKNLELLPFVILALVFQNLDPVYQGPFIHKSQYKAILLGFLGQHLTWRYIVAFVWDIWSQCGHFRFFFSPGCSLMCHFLALSVVKSFSHWEHFNLLPLWIFWCSLNTLIEWNPFSQISQLNTYTFLLYNLTCFFKCDVLWKFLLHLIQCTSPFLTNCTSSSISGSSSVSSLPFLPPPHQHVPHHHHFPHHHYFSYHIP